jgi:hypothetical protein
LLWALQANIVATLDGILPPLSLSSSLCFFFSYPQGNNLNLNTYIYNNINAFQGNVENRVKDKPLKVENTYI